MSSPSCLVFVQYIHVGKHCQGPMHSVENNFDLSHIIEAIKQLEDSGKFDFNCNSLQSLIDQLAAMGYDKDTVTNQLSGIVSDVAGELDVGTGFSDIPLANIFNSNDIAEFDDLPTLADASSDLYDIAGGTGKTKTYFDHHPKMATGGKVIGGLAAASFTGFLIYYAKKTIGERGLKMDNVLENEEKQVAENIVTKASANMDVDKVAKDAERAAMRKANRWWGGERRNVERIWEGVDSDARSIVKEKIYPFIKTSGVTLDQLWRGAKALDDKPLLTISEDTCADVAHHLKAFIANKYSEMRMRIVDNDPILSETIKAEKQAFLQNEINRAIESLKGEGQALGSDLGELEKSAISRFEKITISESLLKLGGKINFLQGKNNNALFDNKLKEIADSCNKYDGEVLKALNDYLLKKVKVDFESDFLKGQIDRAIKDNLVTAELVMSGFGNPSTLDTKLMAEVKEDVQSLFSVETEKLFRDVDALAVNDSEKLLDDIVKSEFSQALRDVRMNVVQKLDVGAKDALQDMKSDVEVEVKVSIE